MKKIFKKFMVLSLGLLVIAAGCKKEDKKEDGYAKDIAGTYVGTLALAGTVVADGVTINVAEKNTTTATLSLNTTLPSLPAVGDLPLDVSCDVTVTKSGDNYTITGNTTVTIAQLGGTPLPVTINGTITAAGSANLTIGITVSVLPLSVDFSGTKQ
ncbi:MAG: calycin-like domain-containing protein [Prevotellaceae bacterium]|jgi:hypothetical protein|nr:calycin-like domain-containing protein [Prevotellaceae bacterium]